MLHVVLAGVIMRAYAFGFSELGWYRNVQSSCTHRARVSLCGSTFVLLCKAFFPPVSGPASVEHGGGIPGMHRWRLPLLLRPRLGAGTASLLPHFVASSALQASPHSEGGEVSFTSWWDREHARFGMGGIMNGNVYRQYTPACLDAHCHFFLSF